MSTHQPTPHGHGRPPEPGSGGDHDAEEQGSELPVEPDLGAPLAPDENGVITPPA
ncbi:MAG: hypothetical protein Q7T70_14620 [Polaromonas sp.]|nr:hypothetical protein [Polaromonas sp.]